MDMRRKDLLYKRPMVCSYCVYVRLALQDTSRFCGREIDASQAVGRYGYRNRAAAVNGHVPISTSS
jgi:hypothetical protein